MSILNDYQVKFIVQNIHGEMKSIKTISPYLSVYILTYSTLDRLDPLIINLGKIINGQKPAVGGFTQSNFYISTTQSEVKIYGDGDAWFDDPNIQPDFVLPTSDLKVIMEEWRDYLANG